MLSDPTKRSAFDGLLAARNARKARFAALDNKRKAMAEELERSERESKRAREGEMSKRVEVERLKEEGRRLRELRAQQAAGEEEVKRRAREAEERKRAEADRANSRANWGGSPAVVELGPLDKTLKIKWLKSAHPSLVDDASVAAFLERALAPAVSDIDSVVLSSKTLANPSKGKHGSGVVAFKTLSAAVRVVKGKEADPEGRWKAFEVGWAAGQPPAALGSQPAPPPPPPRQSVSPPASAGGPSFVSAVFAWVMTAGVLTPASWRAVVRGSVDGRGRDPGTAAAEGAGEADGRDAAAGRGGRGRWAMNSAHVSSSRVSVAVMRSWQSERAGWLGIRV